MTPEHFQELASQGYNRLPVTRKILADLDTPLTTYLKLANQSYTYLLESVEGGEKWGRYSIIGLPCQQRIQVNGHTVTLFDGDAVVEQLQTSDPLQFIETFTQQYHVPELPDLPRCCGGLVGYFGYDAVRYVEPKLADSTPPDDLEIPDILLMVSEELVVFDNLSGTLTLIVFVDPQQEGAYLKGCERLDSLQHKLDQPVQLPQLNAEETALQEQDFKSGFGELAFKKAVDKVKEYILAGDTMQVVLSQRMQIPFSQPPVHLYRALRCLNPSPYMFLLNMGEFDIVGSSPEILVRSEDGEVTVRPIAGTRPRGDSAEQDLAFEQDLLADPKERAEHLMLIDLGRNDVGRIAEIGSVKVTDQMVVERYSHVMHIVSNVTGDLDKQHTAMDVLRATLPAGTLSGAPKIRAMEIIDEFEPVKRGVYGGAVGYLAWNGSMDTAIAIRTAVIKDQKLYVQAGAGLVADSQPQSEWDETMNKGRAIFRAAAMVQNGFKKIQ